MVKNMNNKEKNMLRFIVLNYKNPYPRDVFCWDNEEKIEFNRGRFNQHCYEIVENMRKDLLKEIDNNE